MRIGVLGLLALFLLAGCAQRAAEPPDGKKPSSEQPSDRDLGGGAGDEKLGQPTQKDAGAQAACDTPPPVVRPEGTVPQEAATPPAEAVRKRPVEP